MARASCLVLNTCICNNYITSNWKMVINNHTREVNLDVNFLFQVPKRYEILGYNPHSVADASSGYVPPKLVRTLRVGAEVL